MDRPTTRPDADDRVAMTESDDPTVLPSRRSAIESCRSAARAGESGRPGRSAAGPVLVTGEAGAGKTWLWRRVEAESPPGLRWVAVDLTPTEDPADFYRLIAHEFGLGDSSASRVGLVDVLEGFRADGRRVGLVVEEAHNLTFDLWEEVRVLANRLGRAGGFAAMILVGQTPLALRFATRPFAAIEARLSARVHLGPIGVDEARLLLDQARPGHNRSDDEIESLHRDASGNPGRLLRLVGPAIESTQRAGDRRAIGQRPDETTPSAESAHPPTIPQPVPVLETSPIPAPASPPPLTGPAKPPILVEENVIEVGWAAEDATAPGGRVGSNPRSGGPKESSGGNEEAVEDHYAALQAWREWAENQARRTLTPAEVFSEDEDTEEEDEDEVAPSEPSSPPPPRPDRPTVRAEGEQKFAPFGQLFSRMAQAREPE